MPDEIGQIVAAIGYLAVAVVFLYAAYWAFSFRKAFANRIYRAHALWLGSLSIAALVAVESGLIPNVNPMLTYSFAAFVGALANIMGFAFVDSTVLIARRSDPLLRPILNWSRLRIIVWPVLLVLVLIEVVSGAIDAANSFTSNDPLNEFAFFSQFLILVVIGGPALLLSARRSGDKALTQSIKWAGLAFLSLAGPVLVGFLEGFLNLSNYDTTYSYGSLPWNAAFLIVGYWIYRSCRSLAPMNRMTLDLGLATTSSAIAA